MYDTHCVLHSVHRWAHKKSIRWMKFLCVFFFWILNFKLTMMSDWKSEFSNVQIASTWFEHYQIRLLLLYTTTTTYYYYILLLHTITTYYYCIWLLHTITTYYYYILLLHTTTTYYCGIRLSYSTTMSRTDSQMSILNQ